MRSYVWLPWWLWLWVAVFRLAVLAVVGVAWLIWQLIRGLVLGTAAAGRTLARAWRTVRQHNNEE